MLAALSEKPDPRLSIRRLASVGDVRPAGLQLLRYLGCNRDRESLGSFGLFVAYAGRRCAIAMTVLAVGRVAGNVVPDRGGTNSKRCHMPTQHKDDLTKAG